MQVTFYFHSDYNITTIISMYSFLRLSMLCNKCIINSNIFQFNLYHFHFSLFLLQE